MSVLGESQVEKLGSFENNQERSSCESCIEVNQVSERADDAEADADADAEADAEAEADADADADFLLQFILVCRGRFPKKHLLR